MTVEWIDAPGEWYDDVRGVWSQTDSVLVPFATVDGRRCFAMPPAGFVRRYIASGGVTDFVIHANVRFTTNSGTFQLFRALDGAAHHMDMRRDSSGDVLVFRDTTQLATTNGGANDNCLATLNQWYWISFAGHIADVGGTWAVKVDGTTVLSGTGDTRNGSSGTATKLQIGNENAGVTGTPHAYVRDIIMLINTTTALSQRRVAYLQPNRAGHDADWTPSAGSNWQNVDDRDGAPDDGSTYNAGNASGEKDLYALAPFPSSASTIDAVTEVTRVGKTTNTHQTVKRVIRTNNNEYDSGEIGIPLGYIWNVGSVRETNPQSSAAWDEAEINRLQTGVKVASG